MGKVESVGGGLGERAMWVWGLALVCCHIARLAEADTGLSLVLEADWRSAPVSVGVVGRKRLLVMRILESVLGSAVGEESAYRENTASVQNKMTW